jgi:hypothetical protein
MGDSQVSTDRPPDDREDRPTEASDAEERPTGEAPTHTEPVVAEQPKPSLAQRVPLGRLVLGLVLVAWGVIWLLEALDVVSFSFLAVLPAALIVVGVVLVAGARRGRHSGLIVLGVVLTVILTIASGFDIKLRGGAGDRTERPTTLAEVQREYHLSVGQLTLDFSDVNFSAGPTTVKASVGLGQLTVRVPDGSSEFVAMVKGHVGAGQVMIFGRESSGVDVDLSGRSPGFERFILIGGSNMLTLDLSVGLGQIEVSG